jgi:FHA domain-containing protein
VITVLAADTSSVRAWVAELGEATANDPTAEVIVFAADDPVAVAAAAASDARTIACLPVECAGGWHVADGAERYASVRADAYASCRRSFAEALAHVRAEDRSARTVGPPRLTCLGGLGMLQHAPVAGMTFALAGERTTIGRSPQSDVSIPQGHSDQSNVARLHAIVAVEGGVVTVRDAGSTNGTYMRGERVGESRLAGGDEVAICGVFRFRLDGA